MAEARLNFADLPDGTFSCQAVWRGGFVPTSPAHQNVCILNRYLGCIHEPLPAEADGDAASEAPVAAQASLHLVDEVDGCRVRMSASPRAESPAYQACLRALRFLDFINQAVSDALVIRDDGIAVVVPKERINQRP